MGIAPYVGIAIIVALGFVLILTRRGVARRRAAASGVATPTRGATEPAAGSVEEPVPTGRPGGLGAKVRALFGGSTSEADRWTALEELLIRADVGPAGSRDLAERMRKRYRDGDDVEALLTEEIADIVNGDTVLHLSASKPAVVLVVGVNGSGKTTTIGKLARRLADDGKAVTLAASDTFRAAAGEQLDTWAQRAGAQIVASERGADPGAVAFDAVKEAESNGSDVVLIDTAGRLHTKTPLMEELAKVRRVAVKAAGHEPDEVLLVLDGTTGQNGIAQARSFTEAVGVTGVVLTKMDGSAKGGIILAVREELGVVVKMVGMGEQVGDLTPFDPTSFAENLVSG